MNFSNKKENNSIRKEADPFQDLSFSVYSCIFRLCSKAGERVSPSFYRLFLIKYAGNALFRLLFNKKLV